VTDQIHVHSIEIDGIKTIVRECGSSDSGEAVVMLHGNPGSSEDYSSLLPVVGNIVRALAPDMPGFGKAGRPREFEYSVDGYSAFLDKLLDALSVKRVHFILHDFGGPWGLNWAAANPDRVASLVLLNIGLLPGYKWHKFARIWRTPILGEIFQLTTTRTVFRWVLNSENPKPFPAVFVDRMYDDMDWGMKRAVLKLYRATDDPGALADETAAILKPKNIPALVIWGEKDSFLPVRYADMQKQFFDATVHLLPAVGHWPMIDEPELVEKLVSKFVTAKVGSKPNREKSGKGG
jgi:pimeloyl-ACP methyl ester carboxylesterase